MNRQYVLIFCTLVYQIAERLRKQRDEQQQSEQQQLTTAETMLASLTRDREDLAYSLYQSASAGETQMLRLPDEHLEFVASNK